MSRRVALSVAKIALDAGEAAVNSAVTIAGRLPILAGGPTGPTANSIAEWNDAVSEKVQVAFESATAFVAGWNAMMWGAALMPVTPTGFVLNSLDLYHVTARSAQSRVRSNAMRFGGR